MKIPIKKHTKVRYPKSEWWVDPKSTYYRPTYIPKEIVQDISKGLENPLDLDPIVFDPWLPFEETNVSKQQKVDWNEWHKDMNSMSLEGCEGCEGCSPEFYEQNPKPSLLTKLKNRFKK